MSGWWWWSQKPVRVEVRGFCLSYRSVELAESFGLEWLISAPIVMRTVSLCRCKLNGRKCARNQINLKKQAGISCRSRFQRLQATEMHSNVLLDLTDSLVLTCSRTWQYSIHSLLYLYNFLSKMSSFMGLPCVRRWVVSWVLPQVISPLNESGDRTTFIPPACKMDDSWTECVAYIKLSIEFSLFLEFN